MLAESDLKILIEFWFPFSEIEYTRQRGTWCDGISLLQITAIDRTTIQIAGVGCFPHDYAPFEIDFHFSNRRDAVPRSMILRLGSIAHESHQSGRHNRNPHTILASRPSMNADWAVAVELTDGKPDNLE